MSLSFKFYVSGWNGYGQWNSENEKLPFEIKKFTSISFTPYLSELETLEKFDISIDWAYNLVVINSKILIKGFYHNNWDESVELTHPKDLKFSNCVSGSQYALFYNTFDNHLWRYSLDCDSVEQWKLLNFFEFQENNESYNCNEKIVKFVNSVATNVVLTSEGRLFYSFHQVCTKNIIGIIIDIQCGYEHAILLTDIGNIYTWGSGSRCQLGHGNTENYDEPELIEALAGIKVIRISTGGWHCCAITEFGDLYTWGWNEKGQLGLFAVVSDSIDASEIVNEQKSRSNCKRKRENSNTNKALPNYASPVLIDIYENNETLQKNIVDVACGSKHTVIKLEDGSIWGTGCNQHSQLGFDNEQFDSFSHFVKLHVDLKNVKLKCGTWSTLLVDEVQK